MNELILNLDIFDTVNSALSHGLNSLLTTAKHKGWRSTGRRDTAMGAIIAARTGSGLSFSYTTEGNQLTIYYFKSEVETINSIALNSEAADPAKN